MKNILWVQHASEWPAFSLIARELEKKGYRSIFLCKSRKAFDEYKKLGFKTWLVLESFNEEDLSSEEITTLDKTYGPPNMTSIYLSDLHLQFLFKNPKSSYQLIGKTYKFLEKIFKEEKIDCFIGRETATITTRTAYNFAKNKKIPFYQLTLGPGPGFTNLFDVGEFHVWSELEKAVSQGPSTLNQEEKNQVLEFVQKRLPSSKQKMLMRFVPRSFFKSAQNYVSLLRHDNPKEKKSDPIRVGALRYGRYRFRRQLSWKYITKNLFRYDDVKDDEEFVYFPLYSGLETSYLTHVPYWAFNQVSLIKEVASKLPVGIYLYVKEHPHNPGYLSFWEMRELQKVPNIKIVRPETSSQYLIEKSRLVFVIEGTAGWEAFLSKKPVLCLGKISFYSQSDLVYKAESVNRLGEKIFEAIKNGEEIYKDREEEWLWFIYCVISTSGRGDVVNLKPPYGFQTDPRDIELISTYVDRTLKSRSQKSALKK